MRACLRACVLVCAHARVCMHGSRYVFVRVGLKVITSLFQVNFDYVAARTRVISVTRHLSVSRSTTCVNSTNSVRHTFGPRYEGRVVFRNILHFHDIVNVKS